MGHHMIVLAVFCKKLYNATTDRLHLPLFTEGLQTNRHKLAFSLEASERIETCYSFAHMIAL